MPLPTDISPEVQSFASGLESASLIEVLIEAQSDQDTEAYKLIAERRAQLEDAETLRRMRAL